MNANEQEAQKAWDPATSDGCTLFPDGRWAGCCLEHDRAYFHGGSWADKRAADVRLRRCVAAMGHPVTAWVMWTGVSLFGWAFFPFGPNWGYGAAKDASHG